MINSNFFCLVGRSLGRLGSRFFRWIFFLVKFISSLLVFILSSNKLIVLIISFYLFVLSISMKASSRFINKEEFFELKKGSMETY